MQISKNTPLHTDLKKHGGVHSLYYLASTKHIYKQQHTCRLPAGLESAFSMSCCCCCCCLLARAQLSRNRKRPESKSFERGGRESSSSLHLSSSSEVNLSWRSLAFYIYSIQEQRPLLHAPASASASTLSTSPPWPNFSSTFHFFFLLSLFLSLFLSPSIKGFFFVVVPTDLPVCQSVRKHVLFRFSLSPRLGLIHNKCVCMQFCANKGSMAQCSYFYNFSLHRLSMYTRAFDGYK